MTEPEARAALVRLVRDEGRRVLATLARVTGDLPLAEDAVQDAAVRALESWPHDGVPAEPRAWLTLTARRRAIDILRREAARAGKEAATMNGAAVTEPDEPPPPETVRDDLLRLVFTCCHPALAVETQVALALRTLCGLSVAEVGAALLVPEATMAKRLTRARQKITKAAIPYAVPADHELPDRLRGVLAVVYLLFTTGYAPTGAPRLELVDEAVRLTRCCASSCRASRRCWACSRWSCCRTPGGPPATAPTVRPCCWPTRTAAGGGATSSRRAWCSSVRACAAPPTCPTRTSCRPRSLPATRWRPTWADTDWGAVVSWYDVLLTVADTPVARLNRAVAVGERDGPAAGLAAVDAVDELGGYPLWHAARAELLARLDRVDDADTAYAAALAIPQDDAQLTHLRRRRARLGDRTRTG